MDETLPPQQHHRTYIKRQKQRIGTLIVILEKKNHHKVSVPYAFLSTRSFCSSSSLENDDASVLVKLESARLRYPNPDNLVSNAGSSLSSNAITSPLNLTVHGPLGTTKIRGSASNVTTNGHVLLGRNGCGKTLLTNALIEKSLLSNSNHNNSGDDSIMQQQYLHSGSITYPDINHPRQPQQFLRDFRGNIIGPPQPHLRHVTFSSHTSLLSSSDPISTTAFRVIAQGSSMLNPSAKFLVVRFGLYPLLHRPVSSLSTGEIRKVLLVSALSSKPKLLLLENAFDGLDVSSRASLKDIVSKTLQGFRTDVLVQGVDAKDMVRTQVLLVTHRPEEIVDEVNTISYYSCRDDNNGEGLRTSNRGCQSGAQLMQMALLGEQQQQQQQQQDEIINHATTSNDVIKEEAESWCSLDDSSCWSNPLLPSEYDVLNVWNTTSSQFSHRHCLKMTTPSQRSLNNIDTTAPLVKAENLTIQRGRKDVDANVILKDLNWNVLQNERWLVAGGNGAGKSTLSRLLVQHITGNDEHQDTTVQKGNLSISSYRNKVNGDSGTASIGWVSTELHMQLAKSSSSSSVLTVSDVLLGKQNNENKATHVPLDVAVKIIEWVGLLDDTHLYKSDDNNGVKRQHFSLFLQRKFTQLSQGEQKLVLISAALAKRPSLLILDEPCQGLDLLSRRRVLGLVERICSSTDMSLIYITHHLEELLPCVDHVLHLKDGKMAFCGKREYYNAEKIMREDGVEKEDNRRRQLEGEEW